MNVSGNMKRSESDSASDDLIIAEETRSENVKGGGQLAEAFSDSLNPQPN